ncbi:MAG: PHP domain-containing protein [Ignavibacteriales bacterium]|nr:PHP domain-containing protein [Ignavibacteriales bacterium]
MGAKEQREIFSAEGRADLHLHTTFSDGALTPQELVKKAQAAGLKAIAITDHDHVGALEEAVDWGKTYGVEVISGLELSATFGEKDIHILAYFFDPTDKNLLEYLEVFRKERLRRAERIVEKLNKINIPITLDSVLKKAGEGSIGRPHIANALLDKGLTGTYHEAFTKYIGTNGPAYEKKFQLSPEEAMRLVTSSGGLSFLAHPGNYTTDAELLDLIRKGMDGIEVVHPSHSESRQEYYRGVVNQYFLLESGGSDYHGGKKNDDYAFGAFSVPLHVVETMRSRLFG